MLLKRKIALVCCVCGGSEFRYKEIIPKRLATEWQLSPEELEYVNRQQGEACCECGSSLRLLALAQALKKSLGSGIRLRDAASALAARGARVSLLEINEAGHLTPYLKQFPGYVFGSYPQVDMHDL